MFGSDVVSTLPFNKRYLGNIMIYYKMCYDSLKNLKKSNLFITITTTTTVGLKGDHVLRALASFRAFSKHTSRVYIASACGIGSTAGFILEIWFNLFHAIFKPSKTRRSARCLGACCRGCSRCNSYKHTND